VEGSGCSQVLWIVWRWPGWTEESIKKPFMKRVKLLYKNVKAKSSEYEGRVRINRSRFSAAAAAAATAKTKTKQQQQQQQRK